MRMSRTERRQSSVGNDGQLSQHNNCDSDWHRCFHSGCSRNTTHFAALSPSVTAYPEFLALGQGSFNNPRHSGVSVIRSLRSERFAFVVHRGSGMNSERKLESALAEAPSDSLSVRVIAILDRYVEGQARRQFANLATVQLRNELDAQIERD
jgi:hypothetical protein